MPGVGRLQRAVDYERALGEPPCARSAHFAVHHVAGRPTPPGAGRRTAVQPKLSTDEAVELPLPVDDSTPAVAVTGHWLGTVVPKRHARRSVTRTLLKRRIRMAMAGHLGDLPGGLWVVRLRSGFDVARFPSASSADLQAAADEELGPLIARAGSAARRRP